MLRITLFVIINVFASKQNEFGASDGDFFTNEIPDVVVKIEMEECKKTSSMFFGVNWNKRTLKWQAYRWSKIQSKMVYNGHFSFEEESKAAHASDTLARKLSENGEEGHKLNFPNDFAQVWAEKKEFSSKYLGVSWDKKSSKWQSSRWSKTLGKTIFNGLFKAEEEINAAIESDNLARTLMKNGEKDHALNFPKDATEMCPGHSKYFGVNWNKSNSEWRVRRFSTIQGRTVHNGSFSHKEELEAARASDTLARKLMKNGEEHKLNFPNDFTEEWAEERKSSKYVGVSWYKRISRWQVQRWSKTEGKKIYNGCFRAGEGMKAALASDTLARKLTKRGEDHKLNFPEDATEVWTEKNKKRKRTFD